MIDLKLVQQAVTLARYRNYARAAEALHLSQPALSRSIAGLESALGVGLFHRTRQGIEPTAFGALLLSRGGALLSDAAELERERARRRGLGSREAVTLEGHRLENGADGGGRRDFLAGRGVHAGETLYLLTYSGWHPVRYESNLPRNEPLLYLPLPGVREEVVFCVPREARFVWPDELRLPPR